MASSICTDKPYFSLRCEHARRHDVDSVEDLLLNDIDSGWQWSYSQRALCARILCDGDQKLISKVKFITNEEDSHKKPGFKWLNPSTLDTLGSSGETFFEFIHTNIENFPREPELKEILNTEHWKGVANFLKRLDLRYQRHNGMFMWEYGPNLNQECLQSKLHELNDGQKDYISHFVKALKCDMTSGQGQEWIDNLMDNIVHLSEAFRKNTTEVYPRIHCFRPGTCDRTNTLVEVIIGKHFDGNNEDPVAQTFYDAPCSDCSSPPTIRSNLSSLSIDSEESDDKCECITPKRIVPDYVASLTNCPGMFPLVVTLKPAGEEEDGYYHNVKQMISKLFFQDAVFGLVISPRRFQMSVILKSKEGLSLRHTTVPLYDEENDPKLLLENLEVLYKFILAVLMWAMKTNCKLD